MSGFDQEQINFLQQQFGDWGKKVDGVRADNVRDNKEVHHRITNLQTAAFDRIGEVDMDLQVHKEQGHDDDTPTHRNGQLTEGRIVEIVTATVKASKEHDTTIRMKKGDAEKKAEEARFAEFMDKRKWKTITRLAVIVTISAGLAAVLAFLVGLLSG